MARTPHGDTRVLASHEVLFGRARERDAAVALFDAGARLVTVVGPGGIGKTCVAYEVARRVAAACQANAFVCALGEARDAQGLLRAVARSLALRVRPSPRRAVDADAIARLLSVRAETVLVLDDVDAIVSEVAAFARTCLDRAENVRLVVTSREPLGIDGERVVRLGPLDDDAAAAMFMARAESDGLAADDVHALVRALDRIPLAIELAARRASIISPREILARIEERFQVLRSDRRDIAERHTTLFGTLEWSWDLLDDDEREAFACAGVFAGAFTVDAFEAVVGPAIVSDALDVAEALLRKSLVSRARGGGAARLEMLETLRAFAREKLRTARGRDDVEARHAAHYLARAERAAGVAYGPDAEASLDALEADLPELLRAFARERPRAPAIAARIVVAIGDLVLLRDVVDLRSALFDDARRAADESGDALLRARTRLLEARVTLEVGAPADAETLLLEAIATTTDAGLADAVADAQRSLGWARLAGGRADEAAEPLERALAHHGVAGDVRGQADALAARGVAACMRGALEEGHRELALAHALHGASHDVIRGAKVAEIAKVVGLDLVGDEASSDLEATLRASAAAHRAHGRLWREAIDLFRLAALASSAGRSDETRTLLDDARRAADDAGVRPELSSALAADRLVAPASTRVPHSHAAPWIVGAEARSLGTPSGEQIDLTRHGPLRRLLEALVATRIATPGVAMSADALLEAGWPDERVRYDAGMLRVYTAVRRLRKLGLESALVTRDDGYLLDPTIAFERRAG